MLLIDKETHQKLYLQIYEILKKKIEGSEWTVGSRIPTESQLCRMFDVSRATIRTAILELVRQGFLTRHPGKGTFVCKNSITGGLSMYTNFSEMMFEEGVEYSTNVLAHTVMMPVDGLEKKLDISHDKHVIYIKLLRSVDNLPVLLQEAYVPYHVCPLLLEEHIEDLSFFELFEKKYGIKITKVKNYMEITHMDADEARIMSMPEGSPSVLMDQYFYSTETLVMYTQSVKRTGRPAFIEFERRVV